MKKQLHGEQFLIPKYNLFDVFRKYFPDYPHTDEVIPSFLRLIHRGYPQVVWIN